MTFWDGFLPALGVFAAAGVAYLAWRYWKQTLFAVISVAIVIVILVLWPDHDANQAGKLPAGADAPKELACDNQFADLAPGADAWRERCKDDPAYVEMEKERAIKEAQAKAAAAKAEQDSKAAPGQ